WLAKTRGDGKGSQSSWTTGRCSGNLPRSGSTNEQAMKKCFLLFWLMAFSMSAASIPLEKLSKADQKQRIQGDLASVLVYREGLRKVLNYATTQTNLFPATRLRQARLLPREEKENIWNTWKSYLDYMLALESIRTYHEKFYLLGGDNAN